MLEALVENIPTLARVKDIDSNTAAKGGKLMIYAHVVASAVMVRQLYEVQQLDEVQRLDEV